jgi:antitoxin component YwqK of YwqJK toxin-antitoxin module
MRLLPSAAWIAISGILFAACGTGREASRGPGAGVMQVLASEVKGSELVERYDLNGDGQADVWKTWTLVAGDDGPTGERLLVRKEVDMNFDTKTDLRTTYYKDGSVYKEETDLDFDGRIDAASTYEGGRIRLREMELGFDGRPRVWKHYEDGKLVRKERDTNDSGTPDTWEYYEDGRLARVGRDKDGDGEPESIDEVRATGDASGQESDEE